MYIVHKLAYSTLMITIQIMNRMFFGELPTFSEGSRQRVLTPGSVACAIKASCPAGGLCELDYGKTVNSSSGTNFTESGTSTRSDGSGVMDVVAACKAVHKCLMTNGLLTDTLVSLSNTAGTKPYEETVQ